jgi:phosphoglycerate dehydrogenase-like enzyme
VRLLIGSYLEPALVDRIRAVDPRLAVVYRPDLLGRPRYAGDHTAPAARAPAQEAEWAALVAEAEVMFDLYRPSSRDLPRQAPRLRWVQLSSSGVRQLVEATGLAASDVVVTNVAGVHAAALAEFVALALLYFAKQMPRVLADQRRHRWERFAGYGLRGRTLGVVGLGEVGREVARVAAALGMRVVATRRTPRPGAPLPPGVAAVHPPEGLRRLLAESDDVALTVPHTPATTGLLGEAELRLMRPGAVLVNAARGAVVDEAALVRVLQEGHLGGAALDVFAVEPLPADSPLWDLPNVLVSPHSMSTVAGENDRIVDLFCDNLCRYLAGQPLHHVYDRARGY